jgi:2'-5' RNA ligase
MRAGRQADGYAGAASQLSFDFGSPPGGGAPANDPPKRRLGDMVFFAVLPPACLATDLADLGKGLARRAGVNARSHRAERLHISLLGWRLQARSREADIDAAREIGRRIAWNGFEVALTTSMSFGREGSRPLVLCCSPGAAWALTGLHDRLLATAAMSGLKLKGRSTFEPHLTLAYSKTPIPEKPLDAPVRWMANELVLILSEQGRGRYAELGRWPFALRT